MDYGARILFVRSEMLTLYPDSCKCKSYEECRHKAALPESTHVGISRKKLAIRLAKRFRGDIFREQKTKISDEEFKQKRDNYEGYIKKWETQVCEPSAYTTRLLCQVLGMPAELLVPPEPIVRPPAMKPKKLPKQD